MPSGSISASQVRPKVVGRANEEIELAPGGASISTVAAPVVQRRLAWRDGMLSFDGETLAEAVREIERHTGVAFEFADPSLATLRVGGFIKAHDLQAFTDLLDTNFDIELQRPSQSRARLVRRAPAQGDARRD